MLLKRRLDSTWKSIRIIDDDGQQLQTFDLDRYGRLLTKFEKKSPRNIKLLLSNAVSKPAPAKIFVLPQISPPPLPTPIITSPPKTPGQILQIPQINLSPPETDFKENLSEEYSEESESSTGFFSADEFLFDNDTFENFQFFEPFMDELNF